MSLDLGTMYATVELNDKQYNDTLKQMPQTAESSFRKVANLAGTYLTFRTLYSTGKDLLFSFSEMEEGANRFNAVFGKIQATATETSRKLEKEFNLSRQSALNMLASVGDLLTGFGFSQRSALSLADEASRLGADLYSFTNYVGGAKGATEAITKAMLGETEAMKALGVVIRQTSPEFLKLMNDFQLQGYTESQAKALVVLQEIKNQSKNAIGDWNRPGLTFAQAMQMMEQSAQKASETLGGSFVEGVKPVLQIITGFLNVIGEADKSVLQFAGSVVALTGAFAGLSLLGKNLNIPTPVPSVATPPAVQQETASQEQQAAGHIRKNELIRQSDTKRYSAAEYKAKKQMLLDALEARKKEEAALKIAKANLAVIQSQEAQRYESFLATGEGEFIPNDKLAEAKKNVDDLTGSVQHARERVASAGKAFNDWNAGAKDMIRNFKMGKAFQDMNKQIAVSNQMIGNTLSGIGSYGKTMDKVLHGVALGFNKIKAGALAGLTAVKSGFTSAIASVKSMGVALAGLAKSFLPMLAISAAISGISYLVNYGKNKSESRSTIAESEFNRAKENFDKGQEERGQEQEQMARLQELSRYQKLTANEQTEAAAIVENLQHKYAGLNVELDKTTGRVRMGANAFNQLNEAQQKQALAEKNRELQKQKAYINATLDKSAHLGNFWTGTYSKYNVNSLKKMSLSEQIRIAEMQRNKYAAENDTKGEEYFSKLLQQLEAYKKNLAEAGKLKKSFETGSGSKQKERSQGERKAIQEIEAIQLETKMESSSIPEKIALYQKEMQKIFSGQKNFGTMEDMLTAGVERFTGADAEKELKIKKELLTIQNKINTLTKQGQEIDEAAAKSAFSAALELKNEAEKVAAIRSRRKDLEKQLGAKADAKHSSLTEDELKIRQEIDQLKMQENSVMRSHRQEITASTQADEERARQRQEKYSDKMFERELQSLREEGRLDRVKALLEKAYQAAIGKAESAAREYSNAKKEIDRDGIRTADEKKRLQKLQQALSEAQNKQDLLEEQVYTASKKQQDKQVNSAWSLNKLLAELGQPSGPEEETAKNTKKTVSLLRELKNQTEKGLVFS